MKKITRKDVVAMAEKHGYRLLNADRVCRDPGYRVRRKDGWVLIKAARNVVYQGTDMWFPNLASVLNMLKDKDTEGTEG